MEQVALIWSFMKPKKSILTSRSFGKDLKNLDELKEAISTFITIAGEKLRKQESLCQILSIFIISLIISSYLERTLSIPTNCVQPFFSS